MKNNLLKNRILYLVILVILLAGSGSIALADRDLAIQPQEALPDGPVVARIYYTSQAEVSLLAANLDVWEVHPEQGYLLARLTPSEYSAAAQAGYRIEIDAAKTAELSQPNEALPGQGPESIPGYPCYRTVEETYTTLQQLALNHPNLAQWIDIGDSWDKITSGGPAGYDIYALKISRANGIPNKAKIFVMGSIHAREYATAELVARFAEYLVNNYNSDPDVTWMLDYYEIHIVAIANPDGRKIAEQADPWWRKNTDSDDGCTVSSWWGTDLNRNYPFQWDCCGGADDDPCGETYHGPSAVSEPETQAITAYVESQFPDQRGPNPGDPAPDDAMGIFLDIHSYSELVLWAWGYTSSTPPNSADLQTLGRKFAYFNDYTPQQSWYLYPTDGTTVDYAYGDLGLAAYTFEIGTDFHQSCSSFNNTILPDNMAALFYAAKATRRPYQNPAGPDALNLVATPITVTAGAPITLTALIDDQRYSSGEPTQNIAAAHYSIDAPGWYTGAVTYPMAAVDGAFNEKAEDVRAVIDTTGLAAGRHTIFVEGQDVPGNWGVPTAIFVEIEVPQHAVTLTPAIGAGQGDPGDQVAYALTIRNSGGLQDTYDLELVSGWPAEISATTVGPLAPNATDSLAVTVTIPLTATAGESDIATVTATSQGDGSKTDSSQLTTSVLQHGIVVDPLAAKQMGDPGGQVIYTLQVTNTGQSVDTFDVALLQNEWDTALSATSLGPLEPNLSTSLAITVTIPLTAGGASDTALIGFSSDLPGVDPVTATITTTAYVHGMLVHPLTDAKPGLPGVEVAYTVYVSNTGETWDTFGLSIAEADWDTDLSTASLGPVAPNTEESFIVTVTVPLTASLGMSDTAAIRVASSQPSVDPVTVTLITSADYTYSLAALAEPISQTAGLPGVPVTYTIRLTNTGNITDAFTVEITGTWAFTAATALGPLDSGDSLTLAAGEATTLWVIVTAPYGVLPGSSDATWVTLTSQGAPDQFIELTLTTIAVWQNFYLPVIFR
jgi:murein tripeptide amidase MpaA/uncharacterized membrane protein